jgi:hypothetical protein
MSTKDKDKYSKYLSSFGQLICANREEHDIAEKCLRMVIGGKYQWDKGIYDAIESSGRPVITDNHVQRNISVHCGYYLQNAYDYKWEGDNQDPNAPMELANLYHSHVRHANNMDFVNLMVYFYGLVRESYWEYYWADGEDGAKEIGVSYNNSLGVYKDPQCRTFDWGGPDASILGFGKFVRVEELISQFEEYAEELKYQYDVIRKNGYNFDQWDNDKWLKGRAADMFDTYNGMPKLMEIWDYEYENLNRIYSFENNDFLESAPKRPEAQDMFMRLPGNAEKFKVVKKKNKTLYRRMFCSLLPEVLLIDEPHDNPITTADGKQRMPVVPFSSIIVDDQAKGHVFDSMPLQQSLNKAKSSNLYVAVTNSAPNSYHNVDDYEDPSEAKRRETDGSLPGQRPYRMKKDRVNPPKKEQVEQIDPAMQKIEEEMPELIRNSMQAPSVIQGTQENQETLGQFEGRRESALTMMGPTNSNWSKAQMSCADCEWSMMRTLGNEGIERVIDSGPSTELFPGTGNIVVNMQTPNGRMYDLSQIQRGKVVATQVAYSPTYRSRLLDMLLKIRGLMPTIAPAMDPILMDSMPLPKEQKDKLVSAMTQATTNMIAGNAGGVVQTQAPTQQPAGII